MVESKESFEVERTPFLVDSKTTHSDRSNPHSNFSEDSERQWSRRNGNSSPYWRVYFILLHVVLVATLCGTYGYRWRDESSTRKGSFSPAWEGISYETRQNHVVSHSADTPYAGPPSPENNRAWDDLIYPTYVKLSTEEMIAAGESLNGSLELEEGGYVGVTNAYHQLHCVRQLRLFLYKDTFYPNLTPPQEAYLKGHLDHCLEVLREEIMCTADVSIYTFFWGVPKRSRPDTKTQSKRSCINWDKFAEWSTEHMVPPHAATKGGLSPLWIKEKPQESDE